jgi:thiamine-monophosphate kinase
VPAGEFELIERYLRDLGARRDDVVLGVGDDCAIVAPPPGRQIALAADTLVEGVHFPAGLAAEHVGHRVLAVNLSDLAAMGAEPAWALLTLTLPRSDEDWLSRFAAGFGELAARHGTALVGGDTTAGPLTATVAIAGFTEPGRAIRRAGARPGDGIWVSGLPGEAAAGLAVLQGGLGGGAAARGRLAGRFLRPEPRVALGRALRGAATACIDVSDGLAGDLAKLCAASGVGADLVGSDLPLSPDLAECAGTGEALRLLLGGGDDYELLFTLPPGLPAPDAAAAGAGVTRIGTVRAGTGITLDGGPLPRDVAHGFDHFG